MAPYSLRRAKQLVLCPTLLVAILGIAVTACSNSTLQTSTAPGLQKTESVTTTPDQVVDVTETPTSVKQTPTIVLTATPTVVSSAALNAKLSYVTFQFSDAGTSSQLWLLEPPYQTAKEILNLGPDTTLFSSTIAWSHNGQYIAYTTVKNSYTAIHTINVDSLETQDFGSPTPPELFGPQTFSAIEILPNGWSFQDKWLAASIRYTKEAYGDQWDKTVIYNVKTGESVELSETYRFVAWSATDPDQFLYIEQPSYPNLENQSVHVGGVGQNEPIHTIGDFGIYLSPWMSWSPDGTRAIAVSPSPNPASVDKVILLDINNEGWQAIPFNSSDSEIQPSFWSPDGQWLAIWQGANLCLWAVDLFKIPDPCIEDNGSFLSPVVWTPDSRMFVYQQGLELFTIDVGSPHAKTSLVNLSDLGIKSDNQFTVIYVWIPSSP